MPFIALLILLAISLSGEGSQQSELVAVDAGEHTIRWSVEARPDSTCWFRAALLQMDGEELVDYTHIAETTVLSGATADKFSTPRSASGELTVDLPAGTYLFKVWGTHLTYADGSTEGCGEHVLTLD